MKTTALALALILASGAASAQSTTVTLDNGGVIASDRDCIRGNGTAACQKSTTATTAGGQTASKTRLRTADSTGVTTSVSGAGPNGQTTGRVKQISR